MEINFDQDYNIDDLRSSKQISIRALNACIRLKLFKLSELVEFYETHQSFLKIMNVGSGTNKELIDLCKKINQSNLTLNDRYKQDTNLSNEEIKNVSAQTDTIKNGSEILLGQYFLNLYNLLSVRARNVIKSTLNTVDFNTYKVKILDKGFDSLKFRNAGALTINEIKSFNIKLEEKTAELSTNQISIDEEFIQVITSISLKGIALECLLKYEHSFTTKEFLLFTIFKNEYLPKILKEQYYSAVKYFINKQYQPTTNSEIAEKLSLTIERVRQLKIDLYPLILRFFKFRKDVSQKIVSTLPYINLSKDYIDLSKLHEQFCSKDYEDLQNEFAFEALSTLVEDFFSKVVIEEQQNLFLINNELYNCFNFPDLIELLKTKVDDKRDYDEAINFEGFIYQFLMKNCLQNFIRIKKVCEYLIENLFNFYINPEGDILFKRNTITSIPESIANIVRDNGSPIHIKDITIKLQKLLPEKDITESKVRGNILRISNIISFGRTSTYGLKEWETEQKGIRGGTIKKIVIDLLSISSKPLHISEITEEVNKFRQTNKLSVLGNLKLDTNKTFIFYRNEFVGLKSKSYSKDILDKIYLYGKGPRIFDKLDKDKSISMNQITKLLKNNFGLTDKEISLWLQINNYRLRAHI